MASISSGSITITIQPGEQYRFIATGEAYVDIGGGSTESYRLTGATSEKLLGGFIVATPVTIRVIDSAVEYYLEEPEVNGGLPAGFPTEEIIKAFNAGRFYGPPVARLASSSNRPNTARHTMTYTPVGQPTSGKRRIVSYQFHRIGSGARKTLQVCIDNFFYDVTAVGGRGVASGNAFTVKSVSYQFSSGGAVTQLTKGGLTEWDVANGERESLTDEILVPFAVNDTFIVRTDIEVDYGQYVVYAESTSSSNALNGWIYDPAINTWNKTTTSSVFAPSWSTGTVGNTSNVRGFAVQVLGKFADSVTSEPMVLMAAGDSLIQNGHDGSGDTSYFYRMCTTYNIACGSVGRIGGQSDIVTANAYGTYLVKYANCAFEEFGTNTISGTETLAQIQTRTLNTFAAIRNAVVAAPKNNPFYLIRAHVLLNTNAGNTAPINAKWDAGGLAEQFNTWLDSIAGTPTGPDFVIDPSIGVGGSIRLSTEGKGTPGSNYYLWAAGASSDRLHLTSSGSLIAANNVYAKLPAYV